MGAALAQYFAGLILIALVIGVVVGVVGWLGFGFLFSHINIGWH